MIVPWSVTRIRKGPQRFGLPTTQFVLTILVIELEHSVC